MSHLRALPFFLKRADDVFSAEGFTSTAEIVHGLLRLDPGHLVFQWRVTRTVDRYGAEVRSDQEHDSVREVRIPLRSIAGAAIQKPFFPWGSARCVVLAADLAGFEPLVGPDGLRLDHPARATVRIRRGDLLLAREFVTELELALAGLALAEVESSGQLSMPADSRPRPDPIRGTR